MRVSETPQASILEAFGAQARECEELLIYNENLFQISQLFAAAQLPLEDEPFVAFWEQSVAGASLRGRVPAWTGKLPQLSFPIEEGISGSAAYVAATRRGVAPAGLPEAGGARPPPPPQPAGGRHPR